MSGIITRGELALSLRQELDDVKNYIAGSNNEAIGEHIASRINPHGVDKSQVGLSEVLNVKQATYAEYYAHINHNNNPHSVTAEQVGALTSSRRISTGLGLSGGGSLTSDISLSIDTAYLDTRYALKTGTTVNAETLSGYKHSDFLKMNETSLELAMSTALTTNGIEFFFRKNGRYARLYSSDTISFGTAPPSGGETGHIYIQY